MLKIYKITPRNGEPPFYANMKEHSPVDLLDWIENDCDGSCSIKVVEMTEEKFNKMPEL